MGPYEVGNVVVLRGVIAGGTTNLAATTALGATSISVYNIAGYANGDTVIINPGKPTEERRTVSGTPSGLTITLNSALLFVHALGEEVAEGLAPTVVVTVNLPDATTSTPAASAVAVGVYEAEFTTTLAGAHVYQFAASGAATAASERTFHVLSNAVA